MHVTLPPAATGPLPDAFRQVVSKGAEVNVWAETGKANKASTTPRRICLVTFLTMLSPLFLDRATPDGEPEQKFFIASHGIVSNVFIFVSPA